MKYYRKIGIIVLLSLMITGFALVTTSLVLTGIAIIGTADDFNVYFIYVLPDDGSTATISEDFQTIYFDSNVLKSTEDTASLLYEIKNDSRYYDANVSVNFNAVNIVDGTDYSSNYRITKTGFDSSNTTLIPGKESKYGSISIMMTKPVIKSAQIEFTLTLNVSAVERETIAEAEDEYTAAEYITKLSQGDGINMAIDDPDHNPRYIGKDPNNYIVFNDEIWRIIGVFNGKLKIVRQEPITEAYVSFDVSSSDVNDGYGVNEWSESYIKNFLNTEYLNSNLTEDVPMYTWGRIGSDYYNFPYTSVIKSNYIDLISDETWHTSPPNYIEDGYSNDNIVDATASQVYESERGSFAGKICDSSLTTCNDTVERKATWYGKVGLPYYTDVWYSQGETFKKTREECINGSLINSGNSCADQSWFNNGSSILTVSPAADSEYSSRIVEVSYYGFYFTSDYANEGAYVYPTIYLNSDIKFDDPLTNRGTIDHPYLIDGVTHEQGYSIIEGDLDTFGSIVKIGTQEFYVIGQEDDNHVKLFSKHNLGFGSRYFDENKYLTYISQNSMRKAKYNDSYYGGYLPFTTSEYANNITYETSNVKRVVDKYVDYLSMYGVNVSGRLLNYEEAYDLMYSHSPRPDWVMSTCYWTQEITSSNYIYAICNNLSWSQFASKYYSTSYYGARPVIILEK